MANYYEEDTELLDMFVVHAVELLSEIESDCLLIEAAGDNASDDLVNKVFRAIHTIKGESGFVCLDSIGNFAHCIESVLDLIRDRIISPERNVINLLLSSFDLLKAMVEDVENSEFIDVSVQTIALKQIIEAAAPNTPPPIDIPAVADKPRTRRPRVLLVDDDQLITNLIGHQLKKADITYDSAHSGEEAIAMMRRNLYLVIVSDIHMPGMSGVELISNLKAMSPLVQMIMLSGDASTENVIACMERGAMDFLTKSHKQGDIGRIVGEALERARRWAPLMKCSMIGAAN